MSSHPTILVTAATGIQSSSLIRALNAWSIAHSLQLTIHATARDPSSPSAQSLLTHSSPTCTIKLFQANFEDPSSLVDPSTGATHAFINVSPVLTDPTAELRQGKNIIAALKTHSSSTLQRVVYTSATSVRDPANPDSFAPGSLDPDSFMRTYYHSKYTIEQLTASLASSLSIPYTILRPGTFFTNVVPPHSKFMYPGLADRSNPTITTALEPGFQSVWIDPEDIGRFAARALLLPADDPVFKEKYENRTNELAERRATLAEIVDALNAQLARDPQVKGKVEVKMKYIEAEEAERVKARNPFVASQLFMNKNQSKFKVDLGKVSGLGVEMGSAEAFFERESKRAREAVGLE